MNRGPKAVVERSVGTPDDFDTLRFVRCKRRRIRRQRLARMVLFAGASAGGVVIVVIVVAIVDVARTFKRVNDEKQGALGLLVAVLRR